MTIKDLAESICKSQATLYKYEKGYKSRFVMEVVSYFAELREEAEKTILEHVARKKNKK